jgi:hypothetical protein
MRTTRKRWRTALVAVALLCTGVRGGAVDVAEIEKLLTTSGVVVEIHGAVPTLGLFAVTYRNPASFFDFEQLSLVARDPAVLAQLHGIGRHDRIRIRGRLLPNPSPQPHILAESIELVRKYLPAVAAGPYEYGSDLPRDLLGKTSASFLVHIAQPDEGILVVEYHDAVIPIFVTNTARLATLSRNDVIHLSFRVQDHPGRPLHLEVNEDAPEPLRVLDSIAAKHGRPADMQGALVLFPKSPQIVSNVFALLEKLPGGLTRQYTLVNLESDARFAAIRAKLQAAWDRHAATGDFVNGRNKLVSLKVRVRAKGTFNQTETGQANPQILLDSPDAITIETTD